MRMFYHGSALAVFAWLLTGAACNPKLLVPPARSMGGESPAALPAGAISGGVRVSSIQEFDIFSDEKEFTSNLLAADLTGGLGFDLDARMTATYVSMQAPDENDEYADHFEEAGLDKDLRAVALRLKWNPAHSRFIAFSGGGGYGSWAGRGYYSTEVAVLLGYENRYFVPYLNFRRGYNVPMQRDSVRWADSPNWEPYAKYTVPSHSQEWILGFKVPLRLYEGPPNRSLDRNPPYFTLEVGMLDIIDPQDGFSGSTVAFSFHFPLRHAP